MTTISPFKEGASIQLAQGVLRGVGPMGPRGYTGPAGPPGVQGPQGEEASFIPVTAAYTRSSAFTPTNNQTWQRMAMMTTGYNLGNWTSLNPDGTIRVTGEHADGIAVLFTPAVIVVPGAAGTETFRIEVGLFLGTSPTPFATTTFTHNNGATSSNFSYTSQYLLPQGFTDVGVGVKIYGAAVSPLVSFASLNIANTGGTQGGVGPQGIQGPVGPDGPVGPAGNANSGFTMFDAITQVGIDSDADPGGTTGTPVQGLTPPIGAQAPAVPFFITRLANNAARRIVRRFADEASMVAAADKEVGQIAFLSSNNALRVMTSAGGTPTPATVAQVTYGTTDPTGTYPAGTIYFKVA